MEVEKKAEDRISDTSINLHREDIPKRKTCGKIGQAVCLLALFLLLGGCASMNSGNSSQMTAAFAIFSPFAEADFDAAGYVQGILDNIYLGDSGQYRRMVEITEEEAYAEYLAGVEAEADYFLKYYNLEVSEELREDIIKLYQQIYAKAQYEVTGVTKAPEGESYQVEVVISPIDVFLHSEEDILDAVAVFIEKADSADYFSPEIDVMADFWENVNLEKFEKEKQQLSDEICRIILKTIRENLPESDYLEERTVVVKVEKDSNGFYSSDSEAIAQMDREIIAYIQR